jgi:hypothetical protein
MTISSAKGDIRILSRLISAGKWTDELRPDGPGGHTVWRWEPVSSSTAFSNRRCSCRFRIEALAQGLSRIVKVRSFCKAALPRSY